MTLRSAALSLCLLLCGAGAYAQVGGATYADSADFTLNTTGLSPIVGGAAYADSSDFTLNTTGLSPVIGGAAYADSSDFTLNTTGLSPIVGGATYADSADFTLDTAVLAFEPFAPAFTTYTAGDNLIGQTNALGSYWTQAGPDSGNQPVIQSGNLSVPGLATASGNSVKFGGNGTSARLNLGINATSGTWYYSFSLRVTDITGLSSSGVFWAGFNNTAGTQTATPTAVGTRVVTRTATGGFNLGLDKSSGAAGSFVFSPTVFTTSDTIFVVGSYTFNDGSSSDDVSQLWVNPGATNFGLANSPAADLTSTATDDLSAIASFVLFNRSAAEPAGIVVDEVRVGPSWASVTPPGPLYQSIGLRAYDGTGIIEIAVEVGPPTSPVRINKGGTTYGVLLVDPGAPNASRIRIQTAPGVTKAWQKLP